MNKTIYFLITLLILPLGAAFSAGDDIDRFILPETPPTIERVKKPPLDKPETRKQDFVSELDITPPQGLIALNYCSFDNEQYPITAQIQQGSFSTLTGHFRFASQSGWEAGCRMLNSVGEFPNLARDDKQGYYRVERFLSSNFQGSLRLEADQDTVWTQHHDFYSFETGGSWYARDNLNLKTRISYVRGEIPEMESNDTFAGDLTLDWQPWQKHDVQVSIVPRKDTAFINDAAVTTAALMYRVVFRDNMTIGAGVRFQNDSLYPQAEGTWLLIPQMRLNVLYQPGKERPDWAGLYRGGAFVKTSPDLLLPESSFALRETLSFYWNAYDKAYIAFSQGSWKNYIYWLPVAGTDFIMPANYPESYVSSMEAGYEYTGDVFSPRFTITRLSHPDLPLLPEYRAKCSLDCRLGPWTLGTGYEYRSSQYLALGSRDQLAGFGSLSASVKRTIASGIEVFVLGGNLLGDTQERQPGFSSKASIFAAGVTVKF